MDLNTAMFWFLGIFGGLLFIFMSYLLYYKVKLDKQGKIRANFIYDDRTIERKSYYGIVDKLVFDDLDYDYNDNLTIKIKSVKHIFYYIGNKNPIDIHNPKENLMNYADFKKILKSKVLKDLLEDEEKGLSKFEMLVLVGIGITAILVIGVAWYYSQQPQPMMMTNSTVETIRTIVTDVIRG